MILQSLSFDIDFDSFHDFLVANVPDADGIVSTDSGFEVIEKTPFSQADIDAVNGYYSALTQSGETSKNTPTMQEIIAQKILNRINFGQQLMANFGAQNILAGYTTSQIQQIAGQLQTVQALMQSGSLETTKAVMLAITPSTLITQTTINNFAQQIQDYLDAGG